jgi:hypothetical protein
MLREGSALDPALKSNTGSVSVKGENVTAPAGPAAFTDFHTPPPVVPRYTVFPLESPGSTTIAVTRPVTAPYTGFITDAGPTDVHAALKFAALGFAAS